ncbi:MAG: tryptophan synthase subunit alpha [Nitrososphaerota archaeon]|jgi:tryptophan synthase alpha chain|nr:tryptophan synthase subunit alpha [Nitrososphaerota archaeon]
MGGDPDPRSSLEVAGAVLRGGTDVLEIGIPFSDPIADGRSVQAAGVRALRSGTKPADVLRVASEAKRIRDVPIVVMTYFNPILSKGVSAFLDAASRSGVDGVIVPDLPMDEARAFSRAARTRGIDSILLASPTTGEGRMKKIVESTSGFLYLVSVLGVTGAREQLEGSTVKLVRLTKRYTQGKVPLAVGFGISRPEHVRGVIRAGADAAIVGSAIVDMVASIDSGEDEGLRRIETFVRSLKHAARNA